MAKILKRVSMQITEEKSRSAWCHSCGAGLGITPGHIYHDEHLAMIGQPCSCGGVYEDHTHTFIHKSPAYTLIKCDCGEKLECSGFTTTCNCGRDYNWNGTELAPRSQWGEETGEHWTDCY